MILCQPFELFFADRTQPKHIHIVFKIGDLNLPGGWIRCRTFYELVIGLALLLAVGYTVQRLDYFLRKPD